MNSDVLIVEDEALVAMEIQECIEHLGHNVSGITDTGEQAVKLALSLKPDLIILDIRLKGRMNGIEAASIIQESVNVPVIFLTAYSGDEFLKDAELTEPYGYLLKPVQEAQLESAIRIAIHKHRKDAKRDAKANGFSAVLRALPAGIVATDTSLIVKYQNKKAEELSGVTARDVIGKPLSEAVRLRGMELELESIEGIDEVLGEGRSIDFGRHMLLASSGDAVPVQIEITPLRNIQEIIQGAIVAISDLRSPSKTLAKQKEMTLEADSTIPLIERMEDLRNYLEVELVRLSMGSEMDEVPVRHFQEGQIAAYTRILRLIFGENALEDLEYILPQ
jgi:PAS domain S-box-containing protein